MSNTKKTLIHVVEAVFVALLACFIGWLFPDHSMVAGLFALAALSAAAKAARVSPYSGVPDYVNGQPNQSNQ